MSHSKTINPNHLKTFCKGGHGKGKPMLGYYNVKKVFNYLENVTV